MGNARVLAFVVGSTQGRCPRPPKEGPVCSGGQAALPLELSPRSSTVKNGTHRAVAHAFLPPHFSLEGVLPDNTQGRKLS